MFIFGGDTVSAAPRMIFPLLTLADAPNNMVLKNFFCRLLKKIKEKNKLHRQRCRASLRIHIGVFCTHAYLPAVSDVLRASLLSLSHNPPQ
jgi:hypothetical protein